jgi:hypothetical protein
MPDGKPTTYPMSPATKIAIDSIRALVFGLVALIAGFVGGNASGLLTFIR